MEGKMLRRFKLHHALALASGVRRDLGAIIELDGVAAPDTFDSITRHLDLRVWTPALARAEACDKQ